jgi:hypothetical protein
VLWFIEQASSKKRKLDAVIKEQKASSKQQSMVRAPMSLHSFRRDDNGVDADVFAWCSDAGGVQDALHRRSSCSPGRVSLGRIFGENHIKAEPNLRI